MCGATNLAHCFATSRSEVSVAKIIGAFNGHYFLVGEQIPLPARIMSLADMYDALVSERIYKKGWSHEEAVLEILGKREIQFDPVVVDAFLLEADNFKAIAHRYQD